MPLFALLRTGFDRLTLYLPALVLSLFALGSFWLVRSVPDLQPTAANKAIRKDPDYYLHGFSVKSFDASGRLTRELQGAHARHYPDKDVLEIDAIQIHVLNEKGQRMVARADHALAEGESTHPDPEIILTGRAQVIRDGVQGAEVTELRSDKITAFTQSHRVISDSPVEFIRGKDHFTANTMDLNGDSGIYQLQGRVQGVIMPARR
jgi:lipopolysaccharide export system protein LptC